MVKQTNKRRALLAAAENLFSVCRVHELTMDDVAQAAGVSKGTIYRYFQDKDDLLFQVATEGFDELCALVEAAPARGDFTERLLDTCERISAFFAGRRAVMRMIQEHEGRTGCLKADLRKRWLDRRRKLVRAVAALLAQGRSAGAIGSLLPDEALAGLLMGMLRARGRDCEMGTVYCPPLRSVVEVFLWGARHNKELPCGKK